MSSNKLHAGLVALTISLSLNSCTIRYVPPKDGNSTKFLVERENLINSIKKKESIEEVARHLPLEPKRYFLLDKIGGIKLREANQIRRVGEWGFYIPTDETILGIIILGLNYKKTLDKAELDARLLDGLPIFSASPIREDQNQVYLVITDIFNKTREIKNPIPYECLESKIKEGLDF